MSHYFVAANLWLIFAVIAAVGRTRERVNPTFYTFFGRGQWFSPEGYTLFLLALTAVSAAHFVLEWKTRERS